ncbi:hypothetical protein [Marivita sp. S2033]
MFQMCLQPIPARGILTEITALTLGQATLIFLRNGLSLMSWAGYFNL